MCVYVYTSITFILYIYVYRAPDYKMRRTIWNNLLGIATRDTNDASSNNSNSDSDNRNSKSDDNNTHNTCDTTVVPTSSITTLSKHHIHLSADVDIEALAVKYELTGM